MTRIYIDIDIDDDRAAYNLGVEFVEKNSIKYGLSSNCISDLGGRVIALQPHS